MDRRALALGVVGITTLLVVAASAEEVEVVLKEGTNFAAAVSPTDGSMVIDLQGALWHLDSRGGEARAITDGLGDDRLPDMSDDGSRVVFQSYRKGIWDIWMVDPDGSNLTALTEGPFDDREPSFSPDGSRVAFSSDRSGSYDIWVLELETGALTQLTSSPEDEFMPDWTPDGDSLLYVSDRVPEGSSLVRKGLGPDGVEALVASFDEEIASPSVSPDGSRIAVRILERGKPPRDAAAASRLAIVSSGDEPMTRLSAPPDVFPFRAEWLSNDEILYTANGALWRQPLDGEPAQVPFEARVTLNRPKYRRRAYEFPEHREHRPVKGFLRPVVAPVYSTLAFAALGDIWVLPSEETVPVPLTRDEYLDSDPCWSPDGRFLLFSSDREGTMDLWVKDVEAAPGTGERRLTSSSGVEIKPAWSPDGKKIAYVDEQSRLHVLFVESDEDRTLTAPRRGVGIPSWSSDSRHIALAVHVPFSQRYREGYNRVLVVDSSTEQARVLDQPEKSFGGRDGDGPVWSPSGEALAFALDGGLWTMPVSTDGTPTGRPERLTGEPADFPSWTPDGRAILFVSPRGLRRVDVASGETSDIEVPLEFEVRPAGGALVLRNVRLIDGTGAPPQDGMDVLLRGNRIESILPTGGEPSEDVRIVECGGKTLIPGLIEMHTHLSLPAWGSRHGKVWLAYGITSVRLLTDAPYRVLEERESTVSGRRIGPRMFLTGSSMDGSRVFYTDTLAIEDSEELDTELTKGFELGYDLIKTYVRLPDGLQREVIEKAHERGVFVTSHEIYPAVALGVDGIEHVRGTSRRGFSPKYTDLRKSYDDVIELVARSGVYFTPTILIYGGWSHALASDPSLLADPRLTVLFPEWASERFTGQATDLDPAATSAVVAPIFETVSALGSRGSKIIAGTDSPIVPYGLSLIVEIEELSEAGLGPMAAIESSTRVAAEALGVDRDLGTIIPGKLADLVLLDADPLEDIHNLRRTDLIILDGRLLSLKQLFEK
jgi:Tol biopolymer transport system component/imidazolonepropionase-like amidohydrolase